MGAPITCVKTSRDPEFQGTVEKQTQLCEAPMWIGDPPDQAHLEREE
jgi:hypothetical protein